MYFEVAFMRRRCAFAKQLTEEQAEGILSEAKQIEGIKSVSITDDRKFIDVGADEDDYYRIMTDILNIHSRYTDGDKKGNGVSFSRFIYDEE